jgi:hypothetical protein
MNSPTLFEALRGIGVPIYLTKKSPDQIGASVGGSVGCVC